MTWDFLFTKENEKVSFSFLIFPKNKFGLLILMIAKNEFEVNLAEKFVQASSSLQRRARLRSFFSFLDCDR